MEYIVGSMNLKTLHVKEEKSRDFRGLKITREMNLNGNMNNFNKEYRTMIIQTTSLLI